MSSQKGPVGPALAAPVLMEKIDKLFACNVGEYVSLPQLVVVGDQSSGKSSVLEGLTRLSFPRDSGLCTRFATQIIFRRDAKLNDREITASIIPAPDVESGDDQRLRSWHSSGIQTLSHQGFTQMMKEVHEVMGLSTSDGDGKAVFSSSVLRLEICGPQENHLSVIDVPGIFKNTTSGRTTKNDITLVRNMVLRYMENRRSIMLTVVPANVDIATQEIIEMAREVDPEGDRTLRILTKPDLVDKGAEKKVISLVEDGNAGGQLGWIVVRNLSQRELEENNVDRDAEKDILRHTAPWNEVRPENWGIRALRNRLQDVLATNIRREFPSVRIEVSRRLKLAKRELNNLGTERDTPEQQRRILLDIVSKFQDVTQHALGTNYGFHKIFETDQNARLATLVATRNAKFSDDLATRGHQYSFHPDGSDEEPAAESEDSESSGSGDDDESEETEQVSTQSNTSQYSLMSRGVTDCEELQDILHKAVPVRLSFKRGISKWIEGLYEAARGFEIGTFNHTLLSTLMKKQSAKWPALAQGYISDIIIIVHQFIQKVLASVCADQNMFSSIISLLMDDLLEKYRRAITVVDFLLDMERAGTPMTLNHYLNDNLQKCRQKRLQYALAKKAVQDHHRGQVIRLKDVVDHHDMSNSEHTVQDIRDILQSYYKVARKRFVDNVCMQASDHHLVTGPEAPMKLFSATWVNALSDDRLEDIAGEEMASRLRRQRLRKEIKDLEAGRAVLLG